MMSNRRTSLWIASIMTVVLASLAMTIRVDAVMRLAGPPPLEEALSRALEWSPEVLLAKSDLQRAEAQLKAARLRVSRDIAEMYAERDSNMHELESLRRQFDRVDALVVRGVESETAKFDLLAKLRAVESRIATIDASIRYLTGGDDLASPQREGSDLDPRLVLRPEFTQRQYDLLNMEVSLDFEDVVLVDFVKYIDTIMGDKHTIVVDTAVLEYYGEYEMNLRISEATLGQAISILCDTIGDLAFVGRDYGFRVTTLAEAKRIRAPAIPDMPYEAR